MKILVLYSSQSGSTQEIAQYMKDQLVQAGYQADAMPCTEPRNLSAYDGIIIGSPIYMGKWRSDATKFVKNHQQLLSKTPHAFFAVGTSFDGKASPMELDAYLAKERALCPPISEGRFMGRLDYSRLNFFQRMICKMIKAPEGDFRDWKAISKWTLDTAAKLASN